MDAHEAVDAVINILLSLFELRKVSTEAWHLNLVCKVVLYRVRKHEITISKTLHESRSSKTISTVVREVSFTDSEETWNACLQFVVNPDTTHCIVDSRINLHRCFVRIVVSNLLVHLEEVTITSFYNFLT